MDNTDTEMQSFLKEREERLGSRISFRTYALFYGANTGEKREWGVFLYSDGSTFIFEDFDRKPRFLGIEINSSKKVEYTKLERTFKKEDVKEINVVTRSSAMDVIDAKKERATIAKGLGKAFRKTLTEVLMKDGTIYYFELMEPEAFKKMFDLPL